MNKQLPPSLSQQTLITVPLKNIYHSYEDFVSSPLNLGQDVVYVSPGYKSVQSESREKNRHHIDTDQKRLLKNNCIQLHTLSLLFHFSMAIEIMFFQLPYYLKLFILNITKLGKKKIKQWTSRKKKAALNCITLQFWCHLENISRNMQAIFQQCLTNNQKDGILTKVCYYLK